MSETYVEAAMNVGDGQLREKPTVREEYTTVSTPELRQIDPPEKKVICEAQMYKVFSTSRWKSLHY